ncbi:MAG: hypothetical protein M1834_004817 [Cirrosporium novae-zelandiae]|nr:MAG: hypothetical protein M1834_004817 [Cirrosporium novae-zelandiae]
MSRNNSCDATSLELLPPEIQFQILKQIPNIKSLYALLNASPRYFQVYRLSKAAILSHIAQNYITSAALPLAVDALEQRKQRGPRRDGTAVLASLEDFRQKSPKIPYKFSLEILKALVQFHEIVEYLISDFAITRLANIENDIRLKTCRSSSKYSSGAADAKSAFVLSQTEHSRLVRAFYRMELYGQIFYTPESPQDEIALEEQSKAFLQRLEDWELEEFLCVRSYLIERLTDYVNQVEDDFMQDFLEHGPHPIDPGGSQSRWNNDDWFFSRDSRIYFQDGWLEGCLTRGLSTIKAMLAADTSENRFDLLGSREPPENVLSEALRTIPAYHGRPIYEWPETSHPEVGFHDDAEKYNYGWLWAMKDLRPPKPFATFSPDRIIERLRRWGYAIWDHERMKDLEIGTET